MAEVDYQSLFKIRTITSFVCLDLEDFQTQAADEKIEKGVKHGRAFQQALEDRGYTVQTVRLATNPFPEWMSTANFKSQLDRIDMHLEESQIDFCSLGPATEAYHIHLCPEIIRSSARFSCSAALSATDVVMATAAAACIREIAHLGDCKAPEHVQNGMGNFRFCVASAKCHIPFFPVAKASQDGVAIGLENGALACYLLEECKSICHVRDVFAKGMLRAISPVHTVCETKARELGVNFFGIDTSLNPSLDDSGSVARAIEELEEVETFGGPGTVAAAAVITECLQAYTSVKLTGYCGLMLPLCEDKRLAELSRMGSLSIADLLSISHVCGVGIDTLPIPDDHSAKELSALLLDVAGVAARWDKSLSCRVLPVPGGKAADSTSFDSPYLINAVILPLS